MYLSLFWEIYCKKLALIDSPKFASQASKLEILAGVNIAILKSKGSLEAEFFLLRKPVFVVNVFNWLYEAHPHYGG